MLSKLSNTNFRNIVVFNALQLFAINLGWSLIFLFFHKKGFSKIDFVLFFMIACTFACMTIIVCKSIWFKQMMLSGNIMRVVFYLIAAAILITTTASVLKLEFYAIAVLWGMSFFFFWVPFQIIMFSNADKTNRATISGIFFATGTLTGIFAPIISGAIAQYWGYAYVFYISAALMSLAALSGIYIVNKNNKVESVDYTVPEIVDSLGKSRNLVFLEGVLHSIFMLLVPVLTIFFFQNEIEYGSFFTLLNLVSAIAIMVFVYRSDKQGKRLMYVIPLGIGLAISLLALAFLKSTAGYFIGILAISLFYNIALSFFMTITLDAAKNQTHMWIGRELMLNLGRILGGVVILSFIILDKIQYSFLFFSVITLVYMYYLHHTKIYCADLNK